MRFSGTTGAQKIMDRGRQLRDEGKYLVAQEIVNKLVQAEPQNQAAKALLADVFATRIPAGKSRQLPRRRL
jgi:alkyl sulfatase BDS1-like metallo-beta-lactamase superfamily hydrolase